MKYHNKRILLNLILILCVLTVATAQSEQNIQFSINFHNQEIYFPDSQVDIRVSLYNTSSEVYRFRLADNRMFNLDFEVVDLRNIPQPVSAKFTTARTSNQRIFFREVSLNPGEEFSFISTLNEFREFSSGVFVVQASFYPELVGSVNRANKISSNRLTLSVRDGFLEEKYPELMVEQSIEQQLRQRALPPDEVVSYLLEARMHERKSQFFLYLDVESVFRMDPRRDSRFRRLSEAEQYQVLENYREVLWEPAIEDSISRKPISFEVRKTTYDKTNAKVESVQRYQLDSYVEVKQFTYSLQRRDGIWYITEYMVNNLGTE